MDRPILMKLAQEVGLIEIFQNPSWFCSSTFSSKVTGGSYLGPSDREKSCLSIAPLQHMLMQAACSVFLYLRPGPQNVNLLIEEVGTTLTSQMIQKETRVDPVLSQGYTVLS